MDSQDASRLAVRFARETHRALLGRVQSFPIHRVLYHADMDGACAAAAMLELLDRLGSHGLEASWIPTSEFHFSGFFEQNPPAPDRCYISLDINFSSRAGLLKTIGQTFGPGFVLIDDHVLNEDAGDRILIVNPNAGSRPYLDLASSLYAFLAATAEDMHVPEWLPVLGLYFDRQLAAYRAMFPAVPPQTEMDQVIRLSSATYLDDSRNHFEDFGLGHLREAIRTAASWTDYRDVIFADQKLAGLHRENEAEIDRVWSAVASSSEEIAQHLGESIELVRFHSRLQIANIIASRLRGHSRRGLYLAIRETTSFCQFELRMGAEVKGIDLVSLLKQVSEIVELTNFGGHPRAAGGAVPSHLVDCLVEAFISIA